jgi:hypothetical protein
MVITPYNLASVDVSSRVFFYSDSPYALVMAAFEAIPALAGTQDTGFAWTVYTGDLVSHDPDNQLSRYNQLLLTFTFFLYLPDIGIMSCIPRYATAQG